jgi:hypothetical protein
MEIVDELIGRHRGRIANKAGESVLAEFRGFRSMLKRSPSPGAKLKTPRSRSLWLRGRRNS